MFGIGDFVLTGSMVGPMRDSFISFSRATMLRMSSGPKASKAWKPG